MEGYELLDSIGCGEFGQVYTAKGPGGDGKSVAVKVINLADITDDRDAVQKDVALMRQCSHPNLVRVMATAFVESKLWVVMEYVAGGSVLDLARFLQSEKGLKLSEQQMGVVIRDTLRVIVHLHQQGIVHRAVKASNILLAHPSSGGVTVKLTDHGVTGQIARGKYSKPSRSHVMNTPRGLTPGPSVLGTPNWTAPEVIAVPAESGSASARGNRNANEAKCDVWSLGITAFEIATGAPPYDRQVAKAVFQIPRIAPPQLRDNDAPLSFRQFVSFCLVKKVEHRPSSSQVSQHPFIKQLHTVQTRSVLQPVMEAFYAQRGKRDPTTDARRRGTHHGGSFDLEDNRSTDWDALDGASLASYGNTTGAMSVSRASSRSNLNPRVGVRGNPPSYGQASSVVKGPVSVPRLLLERSGVGVSAAGSMDRGDGTMARASIAARTTPRGQRATPRLTPRGERMATPMGTPRGGQVSLSTAAYQSVVKPALVKLSRSQRATAAGVTDPIIKLNKLLDEAQSVCPNFSLLLVQNIVKCVSQSPTYQHMLRQYDSSDGSPATGAAPRGGSQSDTASTASPAHVSAAAPTRHNRNPSLSPRPAAAPLTGPAELLLSTWSAAHPGFVGQSATGSQTTSPAGTAHASSLVALASPVAYR